jgi:HlyD family secretion protein
MKAVPKAAIFAAAGLLAALGWFGVRARLANARTAAGRSELIVTTTAKRQDLLLSVIHTGVVVAKNATPVIPGISGRIQWVCANGIVVSTGETILRLDPTRAQEQVTDLTVRYEEALRGQAETDALARARAEGDRLRLQQAEDEAAAFERQQEAALTRSGESIAFDAAELRYRREDAETKKRLAAKGYVPETDAEREAAAVRAAEFSVDRAGTELELKTVQATSEALERSQNVRHTMRGMSWSRSRSERQIRMSGNEVENLELQLEHAREDLARTTLRAAVEGLVVLSPQGGWRGESRLPRPGDWVSQGREVGQIVSLEQLQVKIELDQSQITMVSMGQSADVTVEAMPQQVLQGKVTAIGQTARRPPVQGWMGMSSTATFPVTVELPPTGTAMIRPGMHATVRIVSRRIEDVIVVPTGCIFERDGHSIVFAERNGEFVPVSVTTGESSGDYTAITQGLIEGERIALNDLGGDTSVEASRAGARKP